jgi:hypothetical protein
MSLSDIKVDDKTFADNLLLMKRYKRASRISSDCPPNKKEYLRLWLLAVPKVQNIIRLQYIITMQYSLNPIICMGLSCNIRLFEQS